MSEENAESPGQYVLKKLFADFVHLSTSKLNFIATQDLEYVVTKCLQRGEDPYLDQLLKSLNEVSAFCLKSMLEHLFKWRDQQISQCRVKQSSSALVTKSSAQKKTHPTSDSAESKVVREYYQERLELAVECLFCMVLVEVLAQLGIHPIPESYVHRLEELAFKHFRAQETLMDRPSSNPNAPNMFKVAGLYAEMIGVLSQARFSSVRRRFLAELKSPNNSIHASISIIEGMKFLRVKMFPVEELEAWFAFLQELANWFIECSRDRLKSAMIQLLMEILLPVAAVISLEVTLPAAKKFVSILYPYCLEQAKKPRHVMEYMPLVTVVLGVSEDHFFLSNWQSVLTTVIMVNLNKKNDTKLQRAALESLYRLLWVYVVRIKCSDNVRTHRELKAVVETLFPKQRGVFPKNMPLSIFVKIIQFIATERLDFAMKEVILELLALPKKGGVIHPERMNIGLRAFLLVADQLEKKEGSPPMPNTFGTLPGKAQAKAKPKHLCNTLTEETVKKIGLSKYLPAVQKSLQLLLRMLDTNVGRPLLATQVSGKTEEELCGGDKKPKLDLLKTCVASIPRLLPSGLNKEELIDLFCRLTVHVDNELRKTAFSGIQNLVNYYPDMRCDVAKGFVMFIVKEVPDTYPQELEYSLKMLLQIITYWRTTVVNENTPQLHSKAAETRGPQQVTRVPIDQSYCSALYWVESLAMVTICSYRPFTRKASLMILKEVRSLREVLGVTTPGDENVMDIIDRATPMIISRYVDTLMPSEKRDARKNMANLDIFWLAEKTNSLLELSGDRNSLSDAWALCLAGLMAPDQLPLRCPMVVRYSWPWIMQRLMKVFQSVDPYFSSSDGHKSSLRGRRTMAVTNVVTLDMFLWRNYLICACCGAPPNVDSRSSDTSVSLDERSSTRLSRPQSARDLLHHVVPLLYYDGEIMEAAITALGMVNPAVFSDLVEELQPMIREALDSKKSEAKSARKSLRRFRENLRVRLTKVFELNAHHGCFAGSTSARVENGRLAAEFEEFIDGIRTYLESESDNDGPLLNELRYHLSGFIARLVMSLPRGEARVRLLPTDVKYNLFHLCGNWCGHLGLMQRRFELQRRPDSAHKKAHTQDLSFAALEAMSALVCSGPVFDPRGLGPSGYMYKWLRSMLSSKDARIQTLGRKTLQQLLQNNTGISLLLNWVVDHCFDQDQTAAQLYFHALSNTLSSIANYPCDIVTTLHVVLFKTGDPDHHIRERAIQLLQFVHNRFYPSSGDKSGPDLISALTWTYYNGHVALSHELARSNPELTLPLFSEMVYRLEMVPRFGQRNILQYMVPWLGNIELVEGAFLPNPSAKVLNVEESATVNNADERSLYGSGWGSVEGTRLVLYNLLCITARYGDDHVKEVEELWGALCQWRKNIHIAINFLIHNARTSSNPFLLQQVKKIIVFFARAHQPEIVDEVMEDMKSVEAVSFEIDAIKQLPRYHLLCLDQGSPSRARRTVLDHSFHEDTLGEPSTSSLLPVDSHYASSSSLRSLGDGTMVPMWVIQWRSSWKQPNGQPIPLPLPNGRSFIPTAVLELLGSGPYEYPIHRCNFAVMFLSELVVDMYNFDWAQFLPQILHLLTLGFDVSRPVVFEHSKKLLINMVIVLACREDKVAASRARMVQRELSLRSPSASSLLHFDETAAPTRESRMASSESLDSILDDGPEESRLTTEARDLIEFISKFSDHYVSHWPYSVVSSKSYSSGDVVDLEELVDRIIRVFGCSESNSLTVDWSQEALYWATKGYSPYAGRSFQVCRALHMSLNSKMMTSILARLVEYAADTNDDVQSYVMEIMLTMEAAVGHTLDTHREYTYDVGSELSWKNLSSLDELTTKTRSGSLRDVKTDEDRISVSSSPYKRVHERTSYASPERLMSSPEKKPSSQRHSAEVELYRKSLNMSTPSESHQVEITLEEEGVQSRSESGGDVASVTETMSFDNRDVEASDQNSKEEKVVTKSSQDVSNKDFVTAEEGQKEPSPLLSPSPDSDTTPTGHSAYVHRRKHSRNQSMSKPMDFQETSLPADNASTISGTSSTLTSTETGPVTQSLPVSHVSQVMSPLSHSVGVSASKMVSSSQTSSPVDSPARSPVRTKKQMRSSTASTSKLIDSSEMSQSLYPPHQPLRRKGSEPSRVRVHELKMAFSRVKRWGSEDQMDATGRGPGRPSSLADTAGYKKRPASWMDFGRRAYSIGEKVIEAADLFAELFVTSVSMLESDYDNEFVMAMRLMEKVMDRFDLNRTDNEEKMDQMISKMNWANFPGVQALLLKGLTNSATYSFALKLLARITPFSIKAVFDPTKHAGFPLNITALLPVMMFHFDQPDEFCVKCAETLSKMCSDFPDKELGVKLKNMSAMFDLYYKRGGRYNKSAEMWASGLCRYLQDAYPKLTTQVLKLLTDLLEKGPSDYHRPVLRLIHAYLKLQNGSEEEIIDLSRNILAVVTQHIKTPLWRESLDILKLSVSNSSSIVAPPTSHGVEIPMMDIGWQALPGPTLLFTMDLTKGSVDMELSKDTYTTSSWKRPVASQRRTRDRLRNLLSSFGPRQEVAPLLVKGGEESETEFYEHSPTPSEQDDNEDRMSVLNEVSQQREEEDLIGLVEDHYNFLDHLEEMEESSMDDDESSLFRYSSNKHSRSHSLENSGDKLTADDPLRSTASVPTLIQVTDMAHDGFKDGGSTDLLTVPEGTEQVEMVELEQEDGSKQVEVRIEQEGEEEVDKSEEEVEEEEREGEEEEEEEEEEEDEVQSQIDDVVIKVSDADKPSNNELVVPVPHMQPPELLPVSRPHPAPSSLTITGTEFTNITRDDVEEHWREHVSILLKNKSGTAAVNTIFLLNRLFLVVRQRFVNLTREASNYLSEHYQSIIQQLLQSVDVLVTQFECPLIYCDVDFMTESGRLDQHLFHVMEIQNNYSSYLEKRKNVIECVSVYKDHLRQQSCEVKESREQLEVTHRHTSSGSSIRRLQMSDEALDLCRAMYHFHFQYLLLLGSYVKLVDLFLAARHTDTPTIDLSAELSEVRLNLSKAVNKWQMERPVSDIKVDDEDVYIKELTTSELLSLMESKKLFEAVDKLHYFRRVWRNEAFGQSDEDDLDVLFYMYAHHIAEKQEGPGIVAVTNTPNDLAAIHSRLMHFNIMLHQQVKEVEQKQHGETESKEPSPFKEPETKEDYHTKEPEQFQEGVDGKESSLPHEGPQLEESENTRGDFDKPNDPKHSEVELVEDTVKSPSDEDVKDTGSDSSAGEEQEVGEDKQEAGKDKQEVGEDKQEVVGDVDSGEQEDDVSEQEGSGSGSDAEEVEEQEVGEEQEEEEEEESTSPDTSGSIPFINIDDIDPSNVTPDFEDSHETSEDTDLNGTDSDSSVDNLIPSQL